MKRAWLILGVLLVMLFGLPMAGVSISGLPLKKYLEFPPKSQFVAHAKFSWYAFFIYLSVIVLAIFPFVRRALSGSTENRKDLNTHRTFPWWGWIGVVLGVFSWVLAWTRFPWFSRFQAHTFTPLWVCFILTVNALCWKRTGKALLTHHTGFFLFLFPCSAGFWWFFEFLNRFVQNWHYSGADYDAVHYFVLASVSFSTVLPAVLSVQQLVLSFSWVERGFERWVRFSRVSDKGIASLGLLSCSMALLLIGIFPNALFAMLWVAPLIIIISLQVLTGQEHVLAAVAQGDWRIPVSAACAALICGWFWEMWNYLSLAKWHYTVPYVDRFHIFEMPCLGYAGYLPFGIECAAVVDLIRRLTGSDKPLISRLVRAQVD